MVKKNFPCTIQRAIDGDTLDVVVYLGFAISVTVRIRIAEIDCPEIHDPDPEIAALALKAKEYAQSFEGKKADIALVGKDRYGRSIVDLFCDEIDYGESLVTLGLAKRVHYNLSEIS